MYFRRFRVIVEGNPRYEAMDNGFLDLMSVPGKMTG